MRSIIAGIVGAVLIAFIFAADAAQPPGPRAGAGTPRDVVDLIEEGAIEVQAQGDSIEQVELHLRNRRSSPVTVRIPVGTFFVAGGTDAQNMVARAEVTVTLPAGGARTASVPAACANRTRDIPGAKDRFTVTRSAHQAELQRLMPHLRAARAPYAVEQAAVWIVTDDADYDDLGVLQEGVGGLGGSRVIGATEAARAMRIVDAAGIDITRRAIWRDRHMISQSAKLPGFQSWLAQREQK